MTELVNPRPKGYQLGWGRVVVATAATLAGERDAQDEAQDLDQALKERVWKWAHSNQSKYIESSEGALPESAIRQALTLASDLGLVCDGLLTDLGQVVHLVDQDPLRDERSPFQHPMKVRWLLWVGMNERSRGFWSAAFRVWKPDMDDVGWLSQAAAHLADRGLPGLHHRIASLGAKRLRETQVRPRLGQLDNLGWRESLPLLREWAENSAAAWQDKDLLEAFVCAEGLEPTSPAAGRLPKILLHLPPELKSIGDEAPMRAVQLLGVASGIEAGEGERWFGAEWDEVLSQYSDRGVRKKTGSDAKTSNLHWTAAAVAIHQTEPKAEEAAGGEAIPADGDRPVDEGPGDQPPGERGAPRPVLQNLPEEHRRAISWLRYLAWWTRGPTPGDLISDGHDSLLLLTSILDHWLTPAQRRRLKGRAGIWSLGGRPIPVLRRAVEDSAVGCRSAVVAFVAEHLSNQQTSADELAAAVPRLIRPGAREDAATMVRGWLERGDGEWRSTTACTRLLLVMAIESGQTTARDIQERLRDIVNHPGRSALELVEELGRKPVARQLRVEGKLGVAGDLRGLGESWSVPLKRCGLGWLKAEDGLEFVKLPMGDETALLPVEVLSFSVQLSAPIELAPRRLSTEVLQAAGRALVMWGQERERDIRVALSTDELPQVYDPAGNAIRFQAHRVVPADAGLGHWEREDWFDRRPVRVGDAWEERGREDFQRSLRETRPADRLVALWFAVEHAFPDGADGISVTTCLAGTAASMGPRWLVEDAREVARLLGRDDWKNLDRAGILALAQNTDCEWAREVFGRLDVLNGDLQPFAGQAEGWAARAAWPLIATFAWRNRVAHEADRGRQEVQQALERLHRSASVLVEGLVQGRTGPGTSWQSLSARASVLFRTAPGDQKRSNKRQAEQTVDASTFIEAFGLGSRQ